MKGDIKVLLNPNSWIPIWAQKLLKVFGIKKDYKVEDKNQLTVIVEIIDTGHKVYVPLYLNADLFKLGGEIGGACGKTYTNWEVWPIIRYYRFRKYAGVVGIPAE